MSDYFFDTTVLVAYFKEEDAHTLQILEQVLAGNVTAAVSAITVAEIASSSDMNDLALREKQLATLGLLDIVAVDRAMAERGGELRRQHNLVHQHKNLHGSAPLVLALKSRISKRRIPATLLC